ncbi:hypothetical protein, partial [Micromonospora sp. SL4-19]|uniref:hypothetical protein n=1 Tax=Micromonospora sp. SL4-19 TaxID=3399129 RepID=UPI003A4DFCB3
MPDIVDGYPVDYGTDAETIAVRETRVAARDWLGIPRTVEGMEHYLQRWDARLEAPWQKPRLSGTCLPPAAGLRRRSGQH